MRFQKIVISIFLFTFGTLSLILGLGSVLFGEVFTSIGSILIILGIVMYINIYRTLKNQPKKAFKKMNILYFFLLWIIGSVFLSGLASIWPILFTAQKHFYQDSYIAGLIFGFLLTIIIGFFVFRKIYSNSDSSLSKACNLKK